jgi:acetylornithine deacetylase/succinyl-diaminopimelate desuccinylase-like protein
MSNKPDLSTVPTPVSTELSPTGATAIDWAATEQDATQLLSQYLQYDTTNPPGNEAEAVEFLAETLRQRGFEPQLLFSAPKRANLIVRLKTPVEPKALPCLLYAHADVVPADPVAWSVPPFAGAIQDGFVWGRGALDDKGLGVIFLEALSLLKEHGPPLGRDIILVIAADEELSGHYGAAWLLDHHPELLQAEYVWDEGGMGLQQPAASLYQIAIAEKIPFTIKLTALGTPGHASVSSRDNSNERMVRALYRLKQWQPPFRLTEAVLEMLKTLAPYQPFVDSLLYAQAHHTFLWPLLQARLENNLLFAPLVRNTLNLTVLRGGQASNVIPAQTEAILDVRLLPGEEPELFLANLRSVIGDPKISVEAGPLPAPQRPSSSDTEFYRALEQTLQKAGPPGIITPYLTPGATDSRFFRAAGMKAYGFMPMLLNYQELSRIHGIDERVSVANLRWGIQVVLETLQKL